MSNGNNYEAQLWKLLEEERLADLSQYHQRGFFDEVPLYSRESEIGFLPASKRANEIVLRFALKFLNAVIAYQQHEEGYFAAITVWDVSADPFIPNLFAWCGRVRELKRKLALNVVKTPFAKQIKKLVHKLALSEAFAVLEDTSISDATRVFIAPARAPYPGFAALNTFRGSTVASK
jgi:hypothetical protein